MGDPVGLKRGDAGFFKVKCVANAIMLNTKRNYITHVGLSIKYNQQAVNIINAKFFNAALDNLTENKHDPEVIKNYLEYGLSLPESKIEFDETQEDTKDQVINL